MTINGKVWGVTHLIESNPFMEFHRISIDAGGTCSKHKHEFKWNGFYVESGKLRISVWKNNYDLVDVTDIGPGQYSKVAPNEYHQFEALEDTVAFEVYWPEMNHNDIKRETVGYSKAKPLVDENTILYDVAKGEELYISPDPSEK